MGSEAARAPGGELELAPFALERYFARYEFSTEYILGASDCETLSVAELLALEPGGDAGLANLRLGYTESNGSPSLRREICRIYGTVAPEEILVHSGAEEGVFLFMRTCLKRGDHIIVHTPCYQSLREIAVSVGCTVSEWRADESRGWALAPGDLRRLISPATRAIVVNTPHNPTGFQMEKDDLNELVRIAAERGIILFSDEVYRESEYAPEARLPAACDLYPKAVSLGVMSKSYGLPGLRIGWVATHDREILARMQALKDYTTICASAPGEYLAEIALRHREAVARRNVGIIRSNLALANEFFARHAEQFSWVPPRAGPVAFPRLKGGEVDAFCSDLVTNAGVLLLPGTLFGDGGNHFRIGLGRKNAPGALARFDDYLRSHQ
ncbi:MAG TPA: aminotransferase class I/II-fold pyridoxal phosphate-dependent enzyme [Bacteroidota bacterium]|nr:aminotransferase class I/II-fold pyridoxal phosphate-dependent enzyme [Bacteroidota bacterium]